MSGGRAHRVRPLRHARHLSAQSLTVLPVAHGLPPARGRLRVTPEDFHVTEVLGFPADGSGGHWLLTVEKRDTNSGWVAAQLARTAGVASREVGFSGHKDRHAVTVQAYSVPLTAALTSSDWQGHQQPGYRVIAVDRHSRKLRPGSHRANRFALRVRDVDGDQTAIGLCLEAMARDGVPNYFGPQRFGRQGGNLLRVREWADGAPAPRDRALRGFLLSAARSHVFNLALAARVQDGSWNHLLPGESVLLDGRRSFFRAAEIDSILEGRCTAMDVHPSGPLAGRGAAASSGQAAAVEEAAIAAESHLVGWLASQGLDHERRSLRLPVRELAWSFEGSDLLLEFVLPKGTFATAVLHELLADAWDVGEGGEE